MAVEQVKQFMDAINESPELQEKVNGLSALSGNEVQGALIRLGADNGYTFTGADLNEYGKQAADTAVTEKELSDEQLEQVAGGSWLAASIGTIGLACLNSALCDAIDGSCWIKD